MIRLADNWKPTNEKLDHHVMQHVSWFFNEMIYRHGTIVIDFETKEILYCWCFVKLHTKTDILRNEYSVLKYFEEKYRYNTCPNAAILTLQ